MTDCFFPYSSPEDVRFLMVDPKMLELSIYEGIPHLMADVFTNPKRAAAALGGVLHKMEERYQMMSALGVRSIAQYNARVEKELAAGNQTFRLKPKPGEEEGEGEPARAACRLCGHGGRITRERGGWFPTLPQNPALRQSAGRCSSLSVTVFRGRRPRRHRRHRGW